MISTIDSERIARANQLLLSAVLKGRIVDIAQAAYEIYNKPVVILDNAGKVVCLVPNEKIGYFLWDEWVTTGRTSLEINLEALKCFYENVKPGKNAVYAVTRGRTGVRTGINVCFYENSICAGHCGIMVGDYVPDETDMEIAEILSSVLTHFYSNSVGKLYSNSYRNAWLAKMLSEEATNADLGVMDYNLSTILKKEFAVLVCPIPEIYRANDMGYYICDNIARRSTDMIPIVFRDSLVILCCMLTRSDCVNPCQSEKIRVVLNYLSKYNIQAGISTGFSDIRELKAYYEQACMTLSAGLRLAPGETCYSFSDFAPYQMLAMDLKPETTIHPLVLKLDHYDRKNGTEYLKTYRAYMLAGKDKKYVASELHIHINTLNYRLNLINDLFHIEQLSKREELHIIISFLLVDLDTGASANS